MDFNTVTVVLGSQFGDEGKGAVVDRLAGKYDIVCRCQGGSNAGHTLVVNGKTHKLHLVPSGILHPKIVCVIGNGVVVNIQSLAAELQLLEKAGIEWRGRLLISDKAHLVLDYHKSVDIVTGSRIGTTGQGIGPCLSDKVSRIGFRVQELTDFPKFKKMATNRAYGLQKLYPRGYDPRYIVRSTDSIDTTVKKPFELIQSCVVDTISYLHKALRNGKRVLIEGANALMLDIDFGSYPYVTSSNCSIGGVCTGLGLPPSRVGRTIGVVKSYLTRVGNGPMPTELLDETGKKLQRDGNEFGATTGRVRRCGWLDLPILKYSCMINGYTELVLTKLDVLSGFKEIKVCRGYLEMNNIEVIEEGSEKGGENRLIETSVNYHYTLPSQIENGAWLVPDYKVFPGWNTPIRTVETFEKLPVQAQDYINFVEKEMGVPISCIGVGPERNAIINRVVSDSSSSIVMGTD